jgi:hypothetical protein
MERNKMEKNNFKKILTYAIFYGSLWGITEATLGHVLHYFPVPISGFIMFPIALFFMQRAYRSSKSNKVFLLMGLTAALIKLVDIFIPGLPVIKTLNPMIAIMLEASSVTVLSFLLNSNNVKQIFIGSAAACFFWRVIFIISSLIIDQNTGAEIAFVNYPEKIISFIILNGIVSPFIAFALILIERKIKFQVDSKMKMRTSYSLVLFISAALIQFII